MDYDPQTLLDNRDMIKQVQCVGCTIFLQMKQFLQHCDSCRNLRNIPRAEKYLISTPVKETREKIGFDRNMKNKSGKDGENSENTASILKTRATGNNMEEGTNINSNYSPDIDEKKHNDTEFINRSNSLKTSVQSLENISHLLGRVQEKKLFTQINLQQTPRIAVDPRNPKIFELDDEDMVVRADSFMTNEEIQMNTKSSRKDSHSSKFSNNRFITESPDLSKSKLAKNYFTASDRNLLYPQTQPLGDKEDDEIVVGFRDSQESDSF